MRPYLVGTPEIGINRTPAIAYIRRQNDIEEMAKEYEAEQAWEKELEDYEEQQASSSNS